MKKYSLLDAMQHNCLFCNQSINNYLLGLEYINKITNIDHFMQFFLKDIDIINDKLMLITPFDDKNKFIVHINTAKIKNIVIPNSRSINKSKILNKEFLSIIEIQTVCTKCTIIDNPQYILSEDNGKFHVRLIDFRIKENLIGHYSAKNQFHEETFILCDHSDKNKCKNISKDTITLKKLINIFQDQNKINNYLLLT